MSVEVLELEVSLSSFAIHDLLLDSLLSSEGDVDELTKTISLGSSLLNSVNCSGSPDCVVLNRLNCSKTERTCG